jgi:hypothetical protein
VTPCRQVEVRQRFGERIASIFRIEEPARTRQQKIAAAFFKVNPIGGLLGLLFDLEDGGSIILRNVAELIPDYKPP